MPPPKPKPCHQQWLNMKPTEGGRICPGCHKLVVDFTKANWAEIERVQQESSFTTCGMYRPKQLKYWGREVPRRSYAKAITTVSLAASLNLSFGQSGNNNSSIGRTLIQGRVTTEFNEENTLPLAGAEILLQGTGVRAIADSTGSYTIDVTDDIGLLLKPTLVFSSSGYSTHEVPIDISKALTDTIELNVSLLDKGYIPLATSVTYFYSEPPTLWQRIKWTVKRWFTRKEE